MINGRKVDELSRIQTMIQEQADLQFAERLQEGVFVPNDVWRELVRMFPRITKPEDIVRELRGLGSTRVFAQDLELSPAQIKRLKAKAYFYAYEGEPKAENQGTMEEREKVLSRFAQRVFSKALDRMLGLN